jgi:hypothetical protein
MANPNPSPATRFTPDRHGRAKQKGARDRLSARFLEELADNFEIHGKAAIERLCKADPGAYVRVVPRLQPKQIELDRPLDGMDDGQLAKAIDVLTEIIRARELGGAPTETPSSLN